MTTNTVTTGPGLFTIGATDALTNFSGQVTKCKLVPNVDKGDPVDVLDGGTVDGDRKETVKVEITLLQDLGATKSTTEWLWAHAGETHPFVFTPNSALGKSIEGVLTVERIDIGGDVKAKATSDASFDCIGIPVIKTRAAGA